MKGMNKISRGSGFAGTTSYLQDGGKNKPREYTGIVIGGNISSREAKCVAQELAATKNIRPDISKPVWHNSLRLPKGETLTHAKWNEIGDEYMRQMGFSDLHPRAYYMHDDKDGQHIHIVASRIAYDGKLYLGKNENLKSTKIIQGLEKAFNLTRTKGCDSQSANLKLRMSSKPTKNEIEKAIRVGREPVRLQLQKMVSEATKAPISATNFVELLHAGGVDVRANIATTGRLNGFKFGLQGVWFSGSKLGGEFTYGALVKKGLDYDKDRDGEFLSKLRAGRGDDKSYARTAEKFTGEQHEVEISINEITGDGGGRRQAINSPSKTGTERTNSNFDFDISGKFSGHASPSSPINPTSGVGPVKSGNKVTDELARALHKARTEEAHKNAQINQRYLQKMAEQEAIKQAQKAQVEQEEKNKAMQDDLEDAKMVKIAEGFGFAMKAKIKTTGRQIHGTSNTEKSARTNSLKAPADATPGRN